MILPAVFLPAPVRILELVVCQESVTLSGTSCLELVNTVLIRQVLSEKGSLSHLKLFVGEEQFQWTGLKKTPTFLECVV